MIRNALRLRSQMNLGGWLAGGFVGLVLGLKLIGFSTMRTRKDYEVDRMHCFSCARCCTYCPNDPGCQSSFNPARAPGLRATAAEAKPKPLNRPAPEPAGHA